MKLRSSLNLDFSTTPERQLWCAVVNKIFDDLNLDLQTHESAYLSYRATKLLKDLPELMANIPMFTSDESEMILKHYKVKRREALQRLIDKGWLKDCQDAWSFEKNPPQLRLLDVKENEVGPKKRRKRKVKEQQGKIQLNLLGALL